MLTKDDLIKGKIYSYKNPEYVSDLSQNKLCSGEFTGVFLEDEEGDRPCFKAPHQIFAGEEYLIAVPMDLIVEELANNKR